MVTNVSEEPPLPLLPDKTRAVHSVGRSLTMYQILAGHSLKLCKKKKKVKIALDQAMKAQKWSRGTGVLFL